MFSQFSVKRPYTILVAVIVVIILGVVSLTNMTTDLFPSLNLPYAIVSTSYMGASPEEVEMTVTKPIEQSMSSISNIKSVRSVSNENMSLVILEFVQTANMDSAVIEMRESLDMTTAYMPDAVGSPIILKLNPDMMPVMVLSAAVRDQDIEDSSSYLETHIIPQLESVEGIASVTPSGLVDSEIHVIIRDEKIESVNRKIAQQMMASMPRGKEGEQTPPARTPQMPQISITKDMVEGILKGQNFSMPAGYIAEEGVAYLVRTGDKIRNNDELGNVTVLSLPGIEPIRLKDVAEIVTTNNSGSMYSKVNGNDAVIMTIQKQTEYATSNVSESIRNRMQDIEEKYGNVEMVPLMDQGEYIDIVVNSIVKNLLYGGILAILILLIFLRNVKPTIVIGIAIPISIVTAFVMMYFGNITLNIVSMGGLALGVGMLVDNSIVVIENIYRMRNEGKSAKEAAVQGARQVSGAITASTLTTISVFIPIVFTEGITRQMFTDMGLTIAFSLIASLLIALTLVPMIASQIMVRNEKRDHKTMDAVIAVYTKLLRFSLNHKYVVIIVVAVLLAVSIFGALNLGTEFFPTSDTNQLSVSVNLKKGAQFSDTAAAADEVTGRISEIDDVETTGASISGGMFGMGMMDRGSRTTTASIYVLLKDNRKMTSNEISQLIRDKTSDLGYEVIVNESGGMEMSAMSGDAVSIEIRGREFDTLEKISGDIAGIVESVEGTVDISDGLEEAAPELKVVVDKDKSIASGLTVAQVFMEVNELLKKNSPATTLSSGAKDFDVFVESESGRQATDRKGLENMMIKTPKGDSVALKSIAQIVEARGFTTISRRDQERYVTVSASLAEGYNVGKVNSNISEELSEYTLPDGYEITMGGEIEMIEDSFRDIFLMLALAVSFVYLIMVAQFQSLKSPFIVMFTIPLAFTGGLFALMITGKPVSVISLVGLVFLSGVVVNNGIVFVDYVNQLRNAGENRTDALLQAGRHRLRPIIMTALTTVIALSTMSAGVGMGTELIQPMAITAIGGLLYATVLTLVFIPVLYDAFEKEDRNVTGQRV